MNTFNFAIRTATAIPANLPTSPERSTDLPFKGVLTEMAEKIATTEGMQTADVFVPTSFWLARPGKINKEKASGHSYANGKLRAQFNDWKTEKGKEQERKDYTLTIVARTGKEPDLQEITGGVPGSQMWLKAPQVTKLPTEEEIAAEAAKVAAEQAPEAPAKPTTKKAA